MNSDEVKTNRQSACENNRGQVAVEYVLLLAVGVFIWITLVSQLVSRNPQKPGMVINKWQQILQLIGSDEIEK